MEKNLSQPYFSITIPVYNRETYIWGCIQSCLSQTFTDYEVVVVDDGSSDSTISILNQVKDPHLRILRHAKNRGINAARFSAERNSLGRWIIGLDSDWELFPTSLERLHVLTHALDERIVGVRARQIWDTGFVSPPIIPTEPIDYVGRIKYVEQVGGYDVLGCYRKAMYDRLAVYPERLGGDAGFLLDVLNMHQQGLMLYVEDVLCKQYTNASNSVTRGNVKNRVHHLIRFAPDTLWMYEEIFRVHGPYLRKYGPNQYLALCRNIALQYFYMGNRKQGMRVASAYLRESPFDLVTWTITGLGLIGPYAAVYGNAIRHWLRSHLNQTLRH